MNTKSLTEQITEQRFQALSDMLTPYLHAQVNGNPELAMWLAPLMSPLFAEWKKLSKKLEKSRKVKTKDK